MNNNRNTQKPPLEPHIKKQQEFNFTNSEKKAPQRKTPRNKKENNRALSPFTKGLMVFSMLFFLILIITLSYFLFQPQKVKIWDNEAIPLSKTTPITIERLDNSTTKVKEQKIEKPLPKEQPEKNNFLTRHAMLYFVKINTEGVLFLKGINREIKYKASPLTRTIETLLKGPQSMEINQGALTLIPENSKLLSARVNGDTVFLNFNEAFRFNSLGREGYTAQLKQIVYTSTEFSNITRVQFLIEGDKKEYLGGEGIYIGSPLTRNSFD